MPRNPPVYRQRIPLEHEGIQVNFCKNPACSNFGIPALVNIKGAELPDKSQPRQKTGKRHRDNYTLNEVRLTCHGCNADLPMKSNKGIYEEYARMSRYLDVPIPNEATCPNAECDNHAVPVTAGTTHYHKDGKRNNGAQRYICRACNKRFDVNSSPEKRQKKRDLNDIIFRLLVNKVPFQRICEIVQISMPALYAKVDFFYNQCLLFAGSHESRLPNLPIKRLQISVDRQDYTINWTDTFDKRNVIVHALGSADNRTGFVFGMHLNIDPDVIRADIESAAKECGDYEKKPAFREYARYWLEPDFEASLQEKRTSKEIKKKKALLEEISDSYEEAEQREDVESFDRMTGNVKLPDKGIQIHGEYTMYGHFLLLKQLLAGAEKIRFYMEKESGIRAACLAAFVDDIKTKRCDAFYVKINKEMTINEKDSAMAKGRAALNRFQESNEYYAELSDNSLRALMFDHAITNGQFYLSTPFRDKWYTYPAPTKNEPEKAVSWLTDTGCHAYKSFHLAKLFLRASLHGIDRFFMQVRRRISLLERPIKTSSSTGRTWYGYSPYNPAHAVKVLEIFRVYHNYIHATANLPRRKLKEGETKRPPGTVAKTYRTPAMRIGLLPAPVSVGEVLSYVPRQEPRL